MFVWAVLVFLEQMIKKNKKNQLTSTRPVGFAAGKNSHHPSRVTPEPDICRLEICKRAQQIKFGRQSMRCKDNLEVVSAKIWVIRQLSERERATKRMALPLRIPNFGRTGLDLEGREAAVTVDFTSH